MPKIVVTTENATNAQILLRTVHDVDEYVRQIRARGDRKVLVAKQGEEARAYDEWRADQPEPLNPGKWI